MGLGDVWIEYRVDSMPAERLKIMTWGQVRLRLLGYEPRNATEWESMTASVSVVGTEGGLHMVWA